MIADNKAKRLHEEFMKAERALNNKMEVNMTLEDLEEIRFLQDEVSSKYFEFMDYVNQFM